MVAAGPKRFTVDDYHRMSEAGILAPTEHTELINGEIFTRAAKDTIHTSAVLITTHLLFKLLGE